MNKLLRILTVLVLTGMLILLIYSIYYQYYVLTIAVIILFILIPTLGSKFAAGFYFEKKILELLENNNGRTQRIKIEEYFKMSAPGEDDENINNAIFSTVKRLEKKGIVQVEKDEIILSKYS